MEQASHSSTHILIVEDERPMAKALKIKFSKAGVNVDLAFNGEEAIEKLKATKYDFMLLDLIMPKLDGFGVLQKIKDENIKIPFMITSNLSQQSDMERARELGAVDYVIKSNTSAEDLVAKVTLHLQALRQSEDAPEQRQPPSQ